MVKSSTDHWQNPLPSGGKSIWLMTCRYKLNYLQMESDISTDVAVIGGGFSGLSAALRLAERGKQVTLFEAGALGSGASGRTNGQVIPTLKREDPGAISKRYGPVYGPRVVSAVRDSAKLVFSLAEKYEIACGANSGGWVQPAMTPMQYETIARRAAAWAEAGAEVDILDRQQTSTVLGSDYYRAAWRANSGGSIHPLDLCGGMARAATSLGAGIYTNSPVNSIRRANDGWVLRCNDRAVLAGRVLLTTAADTGALGPSLSNQIVPINFYQLATKPLQSQLAVSLLPRCGSTSDLHGDIYFFRKDAQGRLITGCTFIRNRGWRSRIVPLIRRRLWRVFPQVGNFEAETVWSGSVAMTLDGFPRIAQLGEGFFGWIGCNSRGIALSITLGRQLADLALGRGCDELPFPIEKHVALPFRFFSGTAVAAAIAAARVKDWIVHSQIRRSPPHVAP